MYVSGFTNWGGTAAVDFRGGTELTATDKFDGGGGAQLGGSGGQTRGTTSSGAVVRSPGGRTSSAAVVRSSG